MFRYLAYSGCVLSMVLLCPVAAMPAAKSCEGGPPTAQSYTWNFSREASALLDGVASDAVQARDHAAKLESMMVDANVGWAAHAFELSQIRAEVNDMGSKLCRLETIRRVSAPWEQQAIRRAAPLIARMVANAEAAIQFMNGHQEDLFQPGYRALGTNLYNESDNLARSVREFENYAKVHHEDMQLERTLGLIKRS